MNPDVQKVLDFIREGAKAASGPAKWGFEQVCAYRASAAATDLVVTLMGFVVALTLAFLVVRYTIKNWSGSINKQEMEPLFGTVSFILPVVAIIMFIATLCSAATDIPVIRNPEGAVLSSLAGHQ